MPLLREISLGAETSFTNYSSTMLKHLAFRPGLVSLHIGLSRNERLLEFQKFLEETQTPAFTDLRDFTFRSHVEPELCIILFHHLQNLRFLDFRCSFRVTPEDFEVTPTRNVFDFFADQMPYFADLRFLKMTFSIEGERPRNAWMHSLSGNALLMLAEKYRSLSHIDLSLFLEAMDGSRLQDADIDHFASLLPNLRSIKLELGISYQHLTFRSLKSLGKHCNDLEECEIIGTFDISLLQLDQPCLFPNIRYIAFYLTDRKLWSDDELKHLETVLQHHFPRLRSFAGYRNYRSFPQRMDSCYAPWSVATLRNVINEGKRKTNLI
jgi:hypothetical protein